jgi:hypothetical protein
MPISFHDAAERYVRLVLALGQHDADAVDAYFGPTEWLEEERALKKPLEQISEEASFLCSQLVVSEKTDSKEEELLQLRRQYLSRQISAVGSRASVLAGRRLSFDEEALAFYDAVPPVFTEKHFQEIVGHLDALLPGSSPIPERAEKYRQKFVIALSDLDTVFQTAITECRARTKKYIPLPEPDSFHIEYVRNKSWSGYNWFKGNGESLIQINTDLPIFLERAIDLAAHEGYPGHHVYNSLLENEFARRREWKEFTVYALFSPQSLIAEGTANFGIEVAFPGSERMEYERDVLFPAAHLDASQAEQYSEVQALTARLGYAGNEAARNYLNGAMSRSQAVEWLVAYALMSPERAEQRTRFFDQYRSYVINYNLGQDLVKQYIEARGGTAADPAKRWEEFSRLISSPRLPSGLISE